MSTLFQNPCLIFVLGFAARILERGPTPRNGKKTDQAHPPIHPTKYTNNLQVILVVYQICYVMFLLA